VTEISADLWMFWWVNAHTREGYHWLKKTWELYQSGEQTFDEYTLARLAANTGTMAFLQRDFETFQRCMIEHRELIFRQSDDELIATAALICGVVKTILKEYEVADEMLQVSLGRFRKIGLRTGESLALSAIGRNALLRGRPMHEIRGIYDETLALARSEKDDISVIIALSVYAMAEAMHDDPGARAHLREVIDLSQRVHFYEALSWAMEIWSLVSVREGRLTHAVKLMAAVDHLRQTTQLPAWEDLAAIIQAAGGEVEKLIGREAYDDAWKAGAAMSLDEMVAFALAEEVMATPMAGHATAVRA
jgi:hypothetical protein